MITSPYISIIVPVYNCESYLAKCIDSILNQTFGNFELILINDGSTDNSANICALYQKVDYRIILLSQKNEGVSSARNHGIAVSKGEWLCFVDSDDYVESNYLEVLSCNGSLKNVDFSLCGYTKDFSSNESKIYTFDNEYKTGEVSQIINQAEKNNIINSPVCKLFNSKIVKDNNITFDKNTNYGEDHLFVISYLSFVSGIMVSLKTPYHYMDYGTISLTKKKTNSDRYIYYVNALTVLYQHLLQSNYRCKDVNVDNIITPHLIMCVTKIIQEDKGIRKKYNEYMALRKLAKCYTPSLPLATTQKLLYLMFSNVGVIGFCCSYILCNVRNLLKKN